MPLILSGNESGFHQVFASFSLLRVQDLDQKDRNPERNPQLGKFQDLDMNVSRIEKGFEKAFT